MNRAGEIVASWRFQSFVAIVLAIVGADSARAQVDAMPDAGYYAAVNEFYSGQYRDAERVFRRMTRTGMQANQARWIDSICYQSMLGEVLYQQGRNAEALAAFDQACLLLLSYPDFLRSVQFRARASRRAIVVLPTPRMPVKRKACATRSRSIALASVAVTCFCPTTLSKVSGRQRRATTS